MRCVGYDHYWDMYFIVLNGLLFFCVCDKLEYSHLDRIGMQQLLTHHFNLIA